MNKEIANTILAQLGGGPSRLSAMVGAKNFGVSDQGLTFKIGRNHRQINYVTIAYNAGLDLYDMKFESIRKKRNSYEHTKKVVASFEGIYCDQLSELFTEATGMYLSL